MSAVEDIIGTVVVDGKKQNVSVGSFAGKGKVVGLYFSAHWCPPCRGFTPQLAEFYKKLKSSRPGVFEVVFFSSDQDEKKWAEYFAEMPWLALPYSDRDRKEALETKYEINGIPTLVLIDGETGDTINADAVEDVEGDPEGKTFPWKK